MNNKIELLKDDIKEKLEKAQEEHKEGVDNGEVQATKLMFFIGLSIILAYILIKKFFSLPEQFITEFIMVIGITFCADSIYSWYRRRQISKNDALIYNKVNKQIMADFEKKDGIKLLRQIEENEKDGIKITDIIMNNGLVNIHRSRQELYEKIIKNYLDINKDVECEIICYDGMEDFINKFSIDCLCNYIKKGLQLKILSANPNVSYWTQHEIDMSINLNSEREYNIEPLTYNCKIATKELNEWYIAITNQLSNDEKNKIQLKFYNSLPSLYLFKMGKKLFISGKLTGDADGSNPPIIEYKDTENENDIFAHYKKYFDLIWNDPDLATFEQELLINPQLLIGNKVVDLILQNTCNAMTEILRAACPDSYTKDRSFPLKQGTDPIQAFFTVLDYAEPYESSGERKITRRYNTNGATRLNESLGVKKCNGNIDSLIKGYPITCSHAIGRAMVEERGIFRTTIPQNEPQYQDKIRCASLVLPLKFSEKSRNKTVIDFVHEGKITKNIINIPDIRKVEGRDEDNYSKKSTKVFATVAFEFDENVRHIIVPDKTKNFEYDIVKYNYENGFTSQFEGYPFDTGQVTRRLILEAERCQKTLLEYFGFDSEVVNDADVLMDGKLSR